MRGEIICRASREDREEHESGNQSDTAPRRLFRGGLWLGLLKFLRQRDVAQRRSVKIDQMESDAVFDLAFAQVAQTRGPLPGMDQIIRHVLGEENVASVAAIHHPLRHVDAGPGDVGAPAHVGHLAHRSAVNAHAHGKFRVLLKCLGNLERAPGRFLCAVMKDQRHPVASRQPDELFVHRFADRRGRQHDRSELVEPLLLFLDQQFRITDDVHEKDMPDLEAQIVVGFGRYHGSLAGGSSGEHDYFVSFGASDATIFSKRGSPRSGSQTGNSFKAP
jgi:hypothetical protein